MKAKRVAIIYAQSLIELGDEENKDIVTEMVNFVTLLNTSPDLEKIVFLAVYTAEEKEAVLAEILEKCGFLKLFSRFILYLVKIGRIHLLNDVYAQLVMIDDDRKGLLKCEVSGQEDQANTDNLEKIKNYLKEKTNKVPVLSYEKNAEITAGYRVKAGDFQLDASLDSQLENFKSSLLGVDR